MAGPRLERLTVYPVKSLDGKSVDQAAFTTPGGLVGDRMYALIDADGEYVNGKAEPLVQRLRSGFDLERHRLCVRDVDAPPNASTSFRFPHEDAAAADWFSEFFGYEVGIQYEPEGGYPDDTTRPGPTVISTATIETIADWYDNITPDGMRRRLRANLELGGVPAFWEDRLFADQGEVVRFSIGDAVLEGVNPCQRCVVPSRDPDTGEETPGFRERFIEHRRATRPEWTESDRYDHDFRVMVNTRVPARDQSITVGDPVEILETRAE